MRNKGMLPSKGLIEKNIKKFNYVLLIYPDGENWYFDRKNVQIGYSWLDPYWETYMEIVEFSQDICWCDERGVK